MKGTNLMFEGTVTHWIDERGFGFVRRDDGGEDIFFHITKLPPGTKVAVGDRLRFSVQHNERAGKLQAVDTAILEK
jgi:cold shock CspA family protein